MENRRKFVGVLAVLFAVVAMLVAVVIWLAGEEGQPALEGVRYDPVTYTVTGLVANTRSPQRLKVILFIETHDWYAKPDYVQGEGRELSSVGADGSFAVTAYHQSVKELDLLAGRYAVLLMPESFAGLDDRNAFAQAQQAALDIFVGDVPLREDDEEPAGTPPASGERAPGEPGDDGGDAPGEDAVDSPGDTAAAGDDAGRGGAAQMAFAEVSYDSDFYVRGRVEGLDAVGDYRVILFILTDQWYVKPDYRPGAGLELRELEEDGSFAIRAYHPEAKREDTALATRFALVLVPADFAGITHMNHYDEAEAAGVLVYTGDIS